MQSSVGYQFVIMPSKMQRSAVRSRAGHDYSAASSEQLSHILDSFHLGNHNPGSCSRERGEVANLNERVTIDIREFNASS